MATETERPSLSTSEILLEIEDIVKDKKVGSPEIMALADLSSQLSVAQKIKRDLQFYKSEFECLPAIFQQIVITERIEGRISGEPGYLEAYMRLEQLQSSLESACKREGFPDPPFTTSVFIDEIFDESLPSIEDY